VEENRSAIIASQSLEVEGCPTASRQRSQSNEHLGPNFTDHSEISGSPQDRVGSMIFISYSPCMVKPVIVLPLMIESPVAGPITPGKIASPRHLSHSELIHTPLRNQCLATGARLNVHQRQTRWVAFRHDPSSSIEAKLLMPACKRSGFKASQTRFSKSCHPNDCNVDLYCDDMSEMFKRNSVQIAAYDPP
jgi:hypothetical protein